MRAAEKWVGAAALAACLALPARGALAAPGDMGPGFALPDVNGQVLSLADLRGRPAVLNFWAFWCDTWKDEMPHLRALAEQRDALDFGLVCISVDGTRVDQFRRHEPSGVPFPVLLDVGGRVSAAYRVGHVPTVVLLDGQGRVRSTWTGYPGNHVLLSRLRALRVGEAPGGEQVSRARRPAVRRVSRARTSRRSPQSAAGASRGRRPR